MYIFIYCSSKYEARDGERGDYTDYRCSFLTVWAMCVCVLCVCVVFCGVLCVVFCACVS